MSDASKRTGRAVASVGAIIVLFGALPFGLLAASRARFGSANPLSGIAAPWRWSRGEISDAVSEPLRDDAVINLLIRGSMVLIWLALLVIAMTTIVEVVHLVRHRGLPTPRVRGLGWAQPVARFIAAGLIALVPTASMASSAVALDGAEEATARPSIEQTLRHDDAAGSAQSATGDSRPEPPRPIDSRESSAPLQHRAPTSPTADAQTHTVQQGESVWEIAAAYGGSDDARTLEIADAILDANLGRTMDDGHRFSNPALIRPGWTLLIPEGSVGIGRAPAADPLPNTADGSNPVGDLPVGDDPDEATHGGHVTHVVIEGDTLSSIADEHLDGPGDWPIVFEANVGDEMSDGRVLQDPDLIVPGWELEIPTDVSWAPADVPDQTDAVDDARVGDDAVDAPAAGGESAVEPDEVESPQTSTTIADAPVMTSVHPQRSVDSDPEPEAPTRAPEPPNHAEASIDSEEPADLLPAVDREAPAPPTSAVVPPTSTSVPAAVDFGEAAPPDRGSTESPSAPSPIRVEHAALLAAGILSLVGVRRVHRLRSALPRARIPVPPPEIAATERKLRTIEPGEGAARLDIALRSAAHQLAESGAGIGTVRLATDGHVTLRLTADGRLDAPWVGLGADWELPASVPIELLADEARRTGSPCLALAQIGVDGMGRSVLVDLEAAGITTIVAPSELADDVIRAVAAGIASSLHSEVAHLVAASIDPSCLLGHPNAHRCRSVDEAVDMATALAGSTTTNPQPTFDLRALRTGGEMWEPAIVLFASADRAADRLSIDTLPQPGHGLALVCAAGPDQLTSSGVRIEAHTDRWEMVGFGERSEIVPLGLTASELVEITALLDEAAAPIEQSAAPVTVPTADAVDETFEPIPHDIVVGLLGGVEVRSRDGELGEFERSKTVELIAWLATHRDRATRSAARTALWELDVRDATFANVVSEARRALGRLVPTVGDEEWLARTLNESLPLHDRVVTDADLVEQRIEHARLAPPSHAVEVLRPAVEMIRDMPFAGTSYLWPDADGITSNLVLLATTAAAELAAHALSLGDTELVFWATGHGLRVLPGHEELIALRMRAHARSGDLAGVRQEWESYERVIIADSWSDGEPAPKLLDLRRELLAAAT